MAWRDYNEFLATAREAYDISYEDAQQLYREMRFELEGRPTTEDLYAEAELIAEIVEDDYGPEEEPEEEEREWFDDLEYVEWDLDSVDEYWLEAGEEIEITADHMYED